MLALTNCPCQGGTLDRLVQPAILAVLAEGPLHGYRLAVRISEIPSFARQKPDVSGIYRFLTSMERKGLVIAAWDTSSRGPAKKSYRITPDGRKCLSRWVSTLEDYRHSIASLLKVVRKAERHDP